MPCADITGLSAKTHPLLSNLRKPEVHSEQSSRSELLRQSGRRTCTRQNIHVLVKSVMTSVQCPSLESPANPTPLSENMAALKQMVIIRRRAGMTHQEFFNYHYQHHGALGTVGVPPEETPMAYFQTHFFDSAYGAPASNHHAWAGHNDLAELYFRDAAHMGMVFGSEHVRTRVGPDAANFSDFPAAIAMFAHEEVISSTGSVEQAEPQALVAVLYLQTKGDDSSSAPDHLIQRLHSIAASTFSHCSSKIVGNANAGDEHAVLAYFRGKEAPLFDIAYQVYLKDHSHIAVFREAQREFEKACDGLIVLETAFVCFGKRAVVHDQRSSSTFDPERQPKLPYSMSSCHTRS